jgi:hypothetical protein
VATSADLSSLNASNLTSGTVPTARLGSGTANNTTFLRGDQTWQTISSTPTTAQVLSAYAGASAGGVGTYYIPRERTSPATLVVGGTVAGSNLRKFDTSGNLVSCGFSGTWMYVGNLENNNGDGLYLRIS